MKSLESIVWIHPHLRTTVFKGEAHKNNERNKFHDEHETTSNGFSRYAQRIFLLDKWLKINPRLIKLIISTNNSPEVLFQYSQCRSWITFQQHDRDLSTLRCIEPSKDQISSTLLHTSSFPYLLLLLKCCSG